jgi:hypothetical protein
MPRLHNWLLILIALRLCRQLTKHLIMQLTPLILHVWLVLELKLVLLEVRLLLLEVLLLLQLLLTLLMIFIGTPVLLTPLLTLAPLVVPILVPPAVL